jgi:AhpD family alkylhydroperoxidase
VSTTYPSATVDVPERLSVRRLQPEAYRALLQLERVTAEAGLEPFLRELIKLRASQINGCAYCIDMHTKDARAAGETEQRLYMLDAWREAPLYTARERAALAFTEAVTLVADGHVPDTAYAAVAAEFDEREIAALIMAIAVINVWNRLAISSRTHAGEYQPRARS